MEVGVEGVGEVGEEGEDGGEDVVAGGGAEEGVVGVEECVAGAEGSVWLSCWGGGGGRVSSC